MNSYFQFKQFTIHQDKCAMKVCTDACLFGAWVANKIEAEKTIPKNILDIGAGTGLLSLMLAQKINTKIDAVELNEDACLQSKENIDAANFIKNITVHNADIISFNAKEKYDCIISNPPFFENQLKSNDKERNAAMHATTLNFEELVLAIKNNLNENGSAFLLLPHFAVNEFEKIFHKQNLFITEQVNIKHTDKHIFFRAMLQIGFINSQIVISTISIKDVAGEYTPAFSNLLESYYYHL